MIVGWGGGSSSSCELALENLPLFATVVSWPLRESRVSTVRGGLPLRRVAQSVVHASGGAGSRFNVRFGFFLVSLCLVGFVVALVWSTA